MMKLSTLWKVDANTDEAGRNPVAEQILEAWPHNPGSARFFRSSANFLYRFRREGEPYFLRFADGAERTRPAIQAEMDLVCWLAGRGLAVARPVPSRAGATVETVDTPWGTFHAVVFAALGGEQRELDALDASDWQRWGAALGRLHAATQDYAGQALSVRRTWRDDLNRARPYLREEAPATHAEWEALTRALHALPIEPATFGLIHFDFELDNLVWQNDTIALLDFDDCAHYWYAADIAFALRDLFDQGADLSHPSFGHFIQGYTTHHPLDEQAIATVPLFSRLARLLTYARLGYTLDLRSSPEYPKWLHGLIEKLHHYRRGYEASIA